MIFSQSRAPWFRCNTALTAQFLRILSVVVFLAVPSLLNAYVIGSSNEKWGAPIFGTPGGLVSWSIIPGTAEILPGYSYPYVPLDTFAPFDYAAHLQWAFDQWSAVADIHFQQVPDSGAGVATTPDAGVVRFSGIDGISSEILAFTVGPIGPFYEAQFAYNSTVRFNSDITWSYSDTGPEYNFDRVALHEIGHLLGLGHEQDVPSIMNVFYSTNLPLGLQPDDIAGAQFLYGTVPEPSYSAVLLIIFAFSIARKWAAGGR